MTSSSLVSGPAGYTAAIYAARAKLQPLVFGAELVSDDVVEVDLAASPKVVKTETDTYLARSVIIATGSKYKELGVPGEKELSGHGVSWCATCDGFFFREKDIAVIGGGDSALEEALFLTRFGKTGRPSPRPAPAARPRSTRSAGWPNPHRYARDQRLALA